MWQCLALVGLVGCITTGDQRRVDVTWSLVQLDGSEVACPADWVTTRLVLTDASDANVQILDRFPCTAGAGVSSHLAGASYTGRLEFLDAGDRVVATSFPTTIDVTPFAPAIASKIYVDAGFAELAWSFANPIGACGDGVNPFEAIVLTLSGPSAQTQLFSCHDSQGVTSPLAPGTYHAWLGQGVTGHDIPDVTIEGANHVTDLGHATF